MRSFVTCSCVICVSEGKPFVRTGHARTSLAVTTNGSATPQMESYRENGIRKALRGEKRCPLPIWRSPSLLGFVFMFTDREMIESGQNWRRSCVDGEDFERNTYLDRKVSSRWWVKLACWDLLLSPALSLSVTQCCQVPVFASISTEIRSVFRSTETERSNSQSWKIKNEFTQAPAIVLRCPETLFISHEHENFLFSVFKVVQGEAKTPKIMGCCRAFFAFLHALKIGTFRGKWTLEWGFKTSQFFRLALYFLINSKLAFSLHVSERCITGTAKKVLI